MSRRAVFLDRDGVLTRSLVANGRPHSPMSLEDFSTYDDASEACTALHRAGYLLIVVTNQPEVSRGRLQASVLAAQSAELKRVLPIDDILVCPHDDGDACTCRKPQPGMLIEAAAAWGIDLTASIMVGDRWRDMVAGRAAGCATIFIDRGYDEPLPESFDHIAASLLNAVPWILAHGQGSLSPLEASTIRRDSLGIRIFADGARLTDIIELAEDPLIAGFTTNPTLMRKAGIEHYESFGRKILAAVEGKPVSFEVFADDLEGMEMQARQLATWGDNVYVKIPVTNTSGLSTAPIVGTLSSSGIALNITAVMTLEQVAEMAAALADEVPAVISVFAGRIADAGRDPMPIMRRAAAMLAARPGVELLWASPREVLNVVQAQQTGCDIITMTRDLIDKLAGLGRSLDEFSLDTVRMFHRDAQEAGFVI